MLAALYGSLDIFNILLKYSMSKDIINQQNILGETVLHYAIKNNNYFNREKTIDYLLQCGADQDLPYNNEITVREKILQIKAMWKRKINFVFCYYQQCLSNNLTKINPLVKLSSEQIKNIFRFVD